jgi:DNA invertase Pin-like site-specific DNA recombinase
MADDDILVDGAVEGALYPRVSDPKQLDGYSIETQLDAMLVRAHELRWRIRKRHVFTETHTFEDLFERPALTRLRQAIARGDVVGMLIFDCDRFARDPVWIEMVTQEALHFGATVAFVIGGVT